MREASERLAAAAGPPVSVLIPRTLYPVPEETLEFIRSRDRTYVVEHNATGAARRPSAIGRRAVRSNQVHPALRRFAVPGR